MGGTAKEQAVSVWDDGNVLKLGSGGSFTTLRTY